MSIEYYRSRWCKSLLPHNPCNAIRMAKNKCIEKEMDDFISFLFALNIAAHKLPIIAQQ